MRRTMSVAPVGCSIWSGLVVGAGVGVGFGVAGGVVGPVVGPELGPPVAGVVGAGVVAGPTLQAEISAARASADTSAAMRWVRVGSAEEFDMALWTKNHLWRFPAPRLHSRSLLREAL